MERGAPLAEGAVQELMSRSCPGPWSSVIAWWHGLEEGITARVPGNAGFGLDVATLVGTWLSVYRFASARAGGGF